MRFQLAPRFNPPANASTSPSVLRRSVIIIPFATGHLAPRVMSCLGPLGARFLVLSSEKQNFVRSSRYCARFIHSAPETDAEGVAELLRLEVGVDDPILLPVTTKGFEFVEENRQILSARFRIPPMAALADLKLASDKSRLHALCQQHGLPVLPSLLLNETVISDLANGSQSFQFPALVKPSCREGGNGIHKVESAAELALLFRQKPKIAQDHSLLQRFVDGDDYSLSVFCERGEVKAHTLWRQIVPSSIPYTIPTCIQFVDHPGTLEIGRRLLRILRWEGICDIDLLVDRRSGEVWILEVNARFWGNILSCKQAGVNFPLLTVQAALGRPLVWPTQIDQAVFCFAKGVYRALGEAPARRCLLRHPLRSTALKTSLQDFGPIVRRVQAKLGRVWAERRPTKPVSIEPRKSRDRFGGRHLAGVVFLALQVGSIVYARFIPERFFCWAPYDERSEYRIEVHLQGRLLPASEVADRYRYQARGWEPRSVHNVISMVRQYERTYGKDDGAQVTIHYQTNGHPKEQWQWPQ